ncbi:hypothetical protein D3C74_251520 [compost metagenome]
MERRIPRCKVCEADSLTAHDAENDQQSDNKENDNDSYFYRGEPIFGLTISFNGQHVKTKDNGQKQYTPH